MSSALTYFASVWSSTGHWQNISTSGQFVYKAV